MTNQRLGPVADEQSLAVPPRTTFVLPGRNRSGGVRVTVEMANLLERAGYKTRIAVRGDQRPLFKRILSRLDDAVGALRGLTPDDWLNQYSGSVEDFEELGDLPMDDDEVVIAVGSQTVTWVSSLSRPRRRVRFCHGFHHFRTEQMNAAWVRPMPTLTVSQTLIPGLRKYGGEDFPVWHVPNGISLSDYHRVDVPRRCIGTIWSSNAAKCPDDIRAVVRQLHERLPAVERLAFGAERRPADFEVNRYWRLPPMESVREIYSRSKVWLLMSQAEGLPGPVLEAMACGCVVISSDNEGSREIIQNGVNGLLFPVGDVRACAQLVEQLWTDDGRVRQLASSGLETARAFSWDAALISMRRALDDLMRDEHRWVQS
jgi:glycosyltransferase involved in cell wall biosynthesis